VLFASAAHDVSAQGLNDLRTFTNPRVLENVQPRALPGQKQLYGARQPPSAAERPTELNVNLNVGYTDPKKVFIYNPNTGKNDPVYLRAYDNTLIAPVIQAYPSQTVRIALNNNLPEESVATCPPPNGRNHIIPSCFNITNLHFHGLHVSPAGNSDNVLLEVAPGQKFEYEINIPADHPAGTFWYHSHRHGSTALQVSSGMAGPLIIKGERTLAQARVRGGFADDGWQAVLALGLSGGRRQDRAGRGAILFHSARRSALANLAQFRPLHHGHGQNAATARRDNRWRGTSRNGRRGLAVEIDPRRGPRHDQPADCGSSRPCSWRF
jgi:hypothetical protein